MRTHMRLSGPLCTALCATPEQTPMANHSRMASAVLPGRVLYVCLLHARAWHTGRICCCTNAVCPNRLLFGQCQPSFQDAAMQQSHGSGCYAMSGGLGSLGILMTHWLSQQQQVSPFTHVPIAYMRHAQPKPYCGC